MTVSETPGKEIMRLGGGAETDTYVFAAEKSGEIQLRSRPVYSLRCHTGGLRRRRVRRCSFLSMTSLGCRLQAD
jgi:hypothetical protein